MAVNLKTSVSLKKRISRFFHRDLEEEHEIFSALYRDYHRLVRTLLVNICGGYELDDLVQETFVRIWKGLPKFNGKSGPKTWIYRITVNTAFDHLRKNKKLKRPLELETNLHGTDREEAKMMAQELVQKGLKTLDPIHRTVLVLALMEELSIREIANIANISEGTVKSRLHYAKKKFLEFLDQKGVTL